MASLGPAPAVRDDWSFEVRALPGTIVIQLFGNAPGGNFGWMTRAVRLRGADVTDTGVELRSGEDVDGVEIGVLDRELDGCHGDLRVGRLPPGTRSSRE